VVLASLAMAACVVYQLTKTMRTLFGRD